MKNFLISGNEVVFVLDSVRSFVPLLVHMRPRHASLLASSASFADMWSWNPADARWTQIVYAPGTAAIPSAAHSSVVYDAVGDGLYFVPGTFGAAFAPNWGVNSSFLYFKFNWYGGRASF